MSVCGIFGGDTAYLSYITTGKYINVHLCPGTRDVAETQSFCSLTYDKRQEETVQEQLYSGHSDCSC